jgi:L-2,4-diaminobutyrate decarboxylase
LFQPKESALVLFADVEAAHRSVSFGAEYLAIPNVGVLGSHGAVAVPLLATLLAYGRAGIASWIDASMTHVDHLASLVREHALLESRAAPSAGVLNWRHVAVAPAEIQRRLPPGVFVSTTTVAGQPWLRSVGANPNADPRLVVDAVLAAASEA